MSTENHFRHPSETVTGDKSLPPTSSPHVKEENVCAFVCMDGNMPQIKPYNVPQEMKGKR